MLASSPDLSLLRLSQAVPLTAVPVETGLTRCLRIRLHQQAQGLIPLHLLTEVMPITLADIMPIPEMSDYLMGVGNWRGDALWLVDLGSFLGQPRLIDREKVLPTVLALVVRRRGQLVGFCVEQVMTIEAYDLGQLHPWSAELQTSQLHEVTAGYVIDSDHQFLPLLNVDRLLDPMLGGS
jgi:chemotaxis signal transduction protein